MDNEKEQLNLKDQQCHIFIYGKSTICLVCKRLISRRMNPDIRHEGIMEHLCSSDHTENMRALFVMCIPDLVCDTEDGRVLDIVTKSVFDISVTLGEETSYICQRDGDLFCLMCKICISEITIPFTQVKDNVIQHLRSTVHVNSVKEVCWFYRLNSRNDYLLFHKSVLHCSICEETWHCLETELVQTAVTHLESDSHEVKQQSLLLGLEKTGNRDGGFPNNDQSCDNVEIFEQKYSLDSIKSEVDVEMFNHEEYMDEDKKLNRPLWEEKQDLEMQTDVQKENKVEGSTIDIGDHVTLLADTTNRNTLTNNRSKKINTHIFIDAIVRDRSSVITLNRQFLELSSKEPFCTLCCNPIVSSTKKPKSFISSLKVHFNGKFHMKMVRRCKKKNNDISEELDTKSHGCQADVVENTLQANGVSESASHRVSHRDPNMGDQTATMVLNRTQGIQDQVCPHFGRNQVLNKCKSCLKIMMNRINAMGKKVKNKMYITVRENKCFCGVCQESLTSTDIETLTMSYTAHCEKSSHKERADSHVLLKKREKAKRKKAKKRANNIRKNKN